MKEFALDWSVDYVEKTTSNVLEAGDAIIADVLKLPESSRDFSSVFGKFHESDALAAEWSCKVVLGNRVNTSS